MRTRRRLAAVLAVIAVVAGGVGLQQSQAVSSLPSPCAPVIGIAARGSLEPPGGGGVAGPLLVSVAAASHQRVSEIDLAYPADLVSYHSSEHTGVVNLTSLLKTTAARCPASRFVLVGYSQGAAVVGDTLAQTTVPAASRIRAAILYGDPGFTSSDSFDTGGFTRGVDGLLARPAGSLRRFATRLRSYCHVDDSICQAGAVGVGHWTYGSDRDAATAFVLGRVGG